MVIIFELKLYILYGYGLYFQLKRLAFLTLILFFLYSSIICPPKKSTPIQLPRLLARSSLPWSLYCSSRCSLVISMSQGMDSTPRYITISLYSRSSPISDSTRSRYESWHDIRMIGKWWLKSVVISSHSGHSLEYSSYSYHSRLPHFSLDTTRLWHS